MSWEIEAACVLSRFVKKLQVVSGANGWMEGREWETYARLFPKGVARVAWKTLTGSWFSPTEAWPWKTQLLEVKSVWPISDERSSKEGSTMSW